MHPLTSSVHVHVCDAWSFSRVTLGAKRQTVLLCKLHVGLVDLVDLHSQTLTIEMFRHNTPCVRIAERVFKDWFLYWSCVNSFVYFNLVSDNINNILLYSLHVNRVVIKHAVVFVELINQFEHT